MKDNQETGMRLQVQGNDADGYSMGIGYQGKPVATQADAGEFTAVFENGDRSIACPLANWKAARWSKDGNAVLLQGRVRLEPLNTDIDVTVEYSVVNDHVVRKTIALEQHNASLLYYRLKNRLDAAAPPRSFWSFEQEDCLGGPLFEIFPAAGFRTADGISVGLLTDSGYKNHWTRNVRRRTLQGGMMALKRMPDMELVKASNHEERTNGDHHVEMNFGEVRDFRLGEIRSVDVPDRSTWVRTASGISLPLKLKKARVYKLKLKYRTDRDDLYFSLVEEGRKRDISFNYLDKEIERSPEEWTEITRVFSPIRMVPEEETVHLQVSRRDGKSCLPEDCRIELKDVEILEETAVLESFDTLRAGKPEEKTLFLFADRAESLGDLRKASQVRLAEGLGFEGTEAEKIFFADRQMLIWIPEPDDFTPHVVPSLNYSMDMYNRDSFWTCVAIEDKEVNESVFEKWAMSLDDRGCVRTIWTPYVGDQENSPNESNLYFLIWAYVNRKRYGSRIRTPSLQRALDFCRSQFDPCRTGRYVCRTPAWMDVIWLEKGVVFSVNQGLYVNALKCARELGCDVEEAEIANALKTYRALYDEARGYMAFAEKSYGKWDCKTPSSLLGEFISLWLWDEPILSDKAVIGTLEALPVFSDCVPCLIGADDRFFTRENKPFDPDFYTDPGVYINGGSWFLYEYLAYAAGLMHGWDKAKDRMEKRIRAEFTMIPDEPFSHECLALDGHTESVHKVFGWNTFMLEANKVVEKHRRT